MIVPGPVTSAMSVGCHNMLREYPGTRLVTGLAHVLEEVGRIGADLAPSASGPADPRDGLDADSTQVLEAVPARKTVGPEEIAIRAGVDIRLALRKLGLLTDLGLLRRVGGGYALARRPRPTGRPSSAGRATDADTRSGEVAQQPTDASDGAPP
jgi:DNA processing protein